MRSRKTSKLSLSNTYMSLNNCSYILLSISDIAFLISDNPSLFVEFVKLLKSKVKFSYLSCNSLLLMSRGFFSYSVICVYVVFNKESSPCLLTLIADNWLISFFNSLIDLFISSFIYFV